jgi:hypothetical protein
MKGESMQSTTFRVGAVAALVAAAVVLFVVLSGGDDDDGEQAATTTTPATTEGVPQKPPREPTPTIAVEGGEPVGGVRDLDYDAGDEVRFYVKSDAAEEVHVHGYDVMQDTVPGKPVSFEFTADIEGIFEVELEETHTQIAELTVEPG